MHLTPDEHARLVEAASDAYQGEHDPSKRWPAVVEAVLSTFDKIAGAYTITVIEGPIAEAKAPPRDGRTGKV